jgi:3'-phosphoadenosine 5'-phosphosulfate sulfotransferase (PAPS reductase)/FAD synthetase
VSGTRQIAEEYAQAQRMRLLAINNGAIIPIDLNYYDFIIINSSGGKDSLAAIWEMNRIAALQNYPTSKIIVSHQDLGESEWKGTKDIAQKQAELFGFDFKVSKRKRAGKYDDTLLEYAERRGKWPSNAQRWCTSDFKRGPGARVVTELTNGMKTSKVLYVFGFRAQESPARKKKEVFEVNKETTTKTRTVHNFLPIHDWTEDRVWEVIKTHKLPYHFAYDLGMPRLSCCFCIFAPFDALVIAGQNNPKLLTKYVAAEERMGHTFKSNLSLASVQKAIEDGYVPKKNIAANWNM